MKDTDESSPEGNPSPDLRVVSETITFSWFVQGMAWFYAIMIGLGLATLWLQVDLNNRMAASQAPVVPPAQMAARPPDPRLLVHPVDDRKVQTEHERQILETYGWVDRAKGIVRLPIERAMDLTIQYGVSGGHR